MAQPITILYEDECITVCIKPAGLDSERELPRRLGQERGRALRVVHRLDKPVGGVMVLAATAESAAALTRSIGDNSLEKMYLAVCHGRMAPEQGELRDLLFRDAAKNKSFVVKRLRKGVREAVLNYEVLQTADAASLLRIRLQTGRSHQIRVQFAARKHPLLGDVKYGSSARECPLALWSCRLAFPHPATGVWTEFEAFPPNMRPWSDFSVQEGLSP